MNYENMSFEDFRELALTDPEKYLKVPIEHLRRAAIDDEIMNAKKEGAWIDDSGIVLFDDHK